jgi:hypothetical protein
MYGNEQTRVRHLSSILASPDFDLHHRFVERLWKFGWHHHSSS